MAKDVSEKPVSSNNSNNNSNNTDTTSSTSISDQQKVPPLRIVLNTSGNQKSSSQSVSVSANQLPQSQPQPPTDSKREPNNKPQDNAKNDSNSNVVKSGGKVRIKLGTNKQQQQTNKSTTSTESSTAAQNQIEDTQKAFNRSTTTSTDKQDNNINNNKDNKEELTTNYSHLRRITRRSQRAVQALNNIDDEESISSMTSTDENQNTTNNNNSDTTNSQDNAITTQTSATSSSNQAQPNTSNSSTSNNSSNVDGPRRYKRRKGETSESQLSEHDTLYTYQSYKLPNQNSFELYRNIRKQVEKRLKNLTTVHPKTPHGFRNYMLTRGAYLLDGNKLGNGTNLFMNEDGGLYPAPVIGKYHALRHNRVNYSVPNRAKVPLGLAINSPLYNLFIDQEKERYRMRMQHIKEREKLTLATEQEIVRVYNQAAMAAANQLEPFSVCTMLKHQEVYNYMDSDGVTIQAAEDVQQDLEAAKQEGVRTRRRQHEHIAAPAPSRKTTTNTDEKDDPLNSNNSQQQKESITTGTDEQPADKFTDVKNEKSCKEKETAENSLYTSPSTLDLDKSKTPTKEDEQKEKKCSEVAENSKNELRAENLESKNEKIKLDQNVEKKCQSSEFVDNLDKNDKKNENKDLKAVSKESTSKSPDANGLSKNQEEEIDSNPVSDINESKKAAGNSEASHIPEGNIEKGSVKDATNKQNHSNTELKTDVEMLNESATTEIIGDKLDQVVDMDQDVNNQDQQQNQTDAQAALGSQNSAVKSPQVEEPVLSDDDRRAYNKEVFLSQLQDIDDKWEKIRNDMLIRHKNEAESLHAVQRLEWEWKTKEIGACDVRSTPIIDNTLVPKLNIYSQDY